MSTAARQPPAQAAFAAGILAASILAASLLAASSQADYTTRIGSLTLSREAAAPVQAPHLLHLCNPRRKSEVMNLLESAGFSRANPYYVVQQGKVCGVSPLRTYLSPLAYMQAVQH